MSSSFCLRDRSGTSINDSQLSHFPIRSRSALHDKSNNIDLDAQWFATNCIVIELGSQRRAMKRDASRSWQTLRISLNCKSMKLRFVAHRCVSMLLFMEKRTVWICQNDLFFSAVHHWLQWTSECNRFRYLSLHISSFFFFFENVSGEEYEYDYNENAGKLLKVL